MRHITSYIIVIVWIVIFFANVTFSQGSWEGVFRSLIEQTGIEFSAGATFEPNTPQSVTVKHPDKLNELVNHAQLSCITGEDVKVTVRSNMKCNILFPRQSIRVTLKYEQNTEIWRFLSLHTTQ